MATSLGKIVEETKRMYAGSLKIITKRTKKYFSLDKTWYRYGEILNN